MLGELGLTGPLAEIALFGAAAFNCGARASCFSSTGGRLVSPRRCSCLLILFSVSALMLPHEYWLTPFAPILKNAPIAVALLTLIAMEPPLRSEANLRRRRRPLWRLRLHRSGRGSSDRFAKAARFCLEGSMRAADLDLIFVAEGGLPEPDHWLTRWSARLSSARFVAPTGDDAQADAVVRNAAEAKKPIFFVAHSTGVDLGGQGRAGHAFASMCAARFSSRLPPRPRWRRSTAAAGARFRGQDCPSPASSWRAEPTHGRASRTLRRSPQTGARSSSTRAKWDAWTRRAATVRGRTGCLRLAGLFQRL